MTALDAIHESQLKTKKAEQQIWRITTDLPEKAEDRKIRPIAVDLSTLLFGCGGLVF